MGAWATAELLFTINGPVNSGGMCPCSCIRATNKKKNPENLKQVDETHVLDSKRQMFCGKAS